jgi:hypothetical protein
MRRTMIQCDRCHDEILEDEVRFVLTVIKTNPNRDRHSCRYKTVDLCESCGEAFRREVGR